MNLSGLGRFWNHTDINDAEKLPEFLIRDMCGNSLNPALISSALGNNDTLRQWINSATDGSDNVVAGQRQALTTYTDLCGLIQKRGRTAQQQKEASGGKRPTALPYRRKV